MAISATAAADDMALMRSTLRAQADRASSAAFWLTAPLTLFLAVFFVLPIANMLWRSVHNPVLSEVLPRTSAALMSWNGKDKPPTGAYSALPQDLLNARENGTLGRAATRLNVEMPGFKAMLTVAARQADILTAPYAPAFGAIDRRWGSRETWVAFKNAAEVYTIGFYLSALDMTRDVDRNVVMKAPDDQIYITLFLRTLMVAGVVTLACLVLGYPAAYLLASASGGWRAFLLVLVLLPFWTSIVVRTAAWIVLLQGQGVVNDFIVALPFTSEADRLAMVHNMTGTLVAMIHILLPFMILPIYSSMLSVPPHYVQAARSLGAGPIRAFWDVYLPMTMAGTGAGVMLVFILAIGFYVTPALVGGDSGQLIGNFIDFHMKKSLNWGLAAALSGILLGAVLTLYFLFIQTAGFNRLRIA
jgi:putative spermidine/putrescine transport system permease protein